MTKPMPKLMTANDPLFAPNMIWKYVVVTERINKLGKLEIHQAVCVTEDDVKEEIENFLKYSVINPDAVKGVHYNYGVFKLDSDYVYTGKNLKELKVITDGIPVEEAVNKKMRDLSKALLRLAGDEL
jgi:hypothetical protein